MLIKPSKIGPNDVVSIKLINNEEIIAKVVSIDNNSYTISKPLILNVFMDERTGNSGISMAPYFMLSADPDANFQVDRSHMICITLTNDQAKAGYIKNTTGLDIPVKGNPTQAGLIL